MIPPSSLGEIQGSSANYCSPILYTNNTLNKMIQTEREQLIQDIIDTIMNCVPDYKKTILELLKDGLDRKSTKSLREMLEEL